MCKKEYIPVLIFNLFLLLPPVFAFQFNVKDFAAAGDGKAVDSPAINKAIEAAAEAGGGTVYFPAGTYLCFTIRLKSNTGLYLDHGAVILAASHTEHEGGYDPAESSSLVEVYTSPEVKLYAVRE